MIENLCFNCFSEKKEGANFCPFCGYDNASNREKYPTALREGSILNGQYIIGRVLGQGGFGITYLSFDYQLKIKVAIKEYLPDGMATRMPDMTMVSVYVGEKEEHFNYGAERFLDEARTLAKFIGNKNIAAVKSYFKENNTAYFVMDYVEGISFKSYIKNKGGKVDYYDAMRILKPVMNALAAVHREGFIHRDVTPDNIYISKDNVIKLLDFGSAKYSLGDKSKSLDVILKAGYAPKEQYLRRSKQGPFTDIYSTAACFYASITGYLPPDSLERIEKDELIKPSEYGIDIPVALENAIIKGLEVRAEDRYQSMEEFLAAINSVPSKQAGLSENTSFNPPVYNQRINNPQSEIQQGTAQSQIISKPMSQQESININLTNKSSYVQQVTEPKEQLKQANSKKRKIIIASLSAAGILIIVLFSITVYKAIDYKRQVQSVEVLAQSYQNEAQDAESRLNAYKQQIRSEGSNINTYIKQAEDAQEQVQIYMNQAQDAQAALADKQYVLDSIIPYGIMVVVSSVYNGEKNTDFISYNMTSSDMRFLVFSYSVYFANDDYYNQYMGKDMQIKVIRPDGTLYCDFTRAIYSFDTAGWGNETISTFVSGLYAVQFLYDGNVIGSYNVIIQ